MNAETSPQRPETDPGGSRERPSRWKVVAYTLAVVLVTALTTFSVLASQRTVGTRYPPPAEVPSSRASAPTASPLTALLPFGAQDTEVDSFDLSADSRQALLLHFDVHIEPAATSTFRAALVSFRVECSSGERPVPLQSNGKVSTNVFIARGGDLSGQALTAETGGELRCVLLGSAPYVEPTEDGLTAFRVSADLRADSRGGTHVLALPRLDDATLVRPGSAQIVLSRRIENPTSLDRMSSTVRLTSCTVVGGSRDLGENKCQEWMTSRESATVRLRVVARWLDDEGSITGRTTLWDETLAVSYNTHHLPWTLRQRNLHDRVPDGAEAVVLVVQVESVAGTPFVVHADGTDAVITTSA